MSSTTLASQVSHLFEQVAPSLIASRRHLLPDINTIFVFEIIPTNSSGFYYWTLDLTPDQAGVYPNKPSGPVPRSAQVSTLRIREQDLVDLLVNKTLAPAQAFILGKLKISGSNQSMFKFHHFWHGNHGPEEGKRENTTQAQETKSVEQEEHAQLAKDALKSDVVFGFFRARLEKEPDLVKTLAFVVQVDILKAGKLVATWTIDTKTPALPSSTSSLLSGRVYRSPPRAPTKADAVLIIEDEDYVAIVFDKLNAQRGFLSGRLKVKGNVMLLQKLKTLLTQIKTTRDEPERVFVQQALLESKDSFVMSLRSEHAVFQLLAPLVRLPRLVPPSTSVRLVVTQGGVRKTAWLIAFNQHCKLSQFKRNNIERQSVLAPGVDLQLELDDKLLAELCWGGTSNTLAAAIKDGLVKVEGQQELVPAFARVFTWKPDLVAKL